MPKPSQDEQTAQVPPKGNKAPAEDSQESSGEESIPELIDLREEEEVPPPSPLKRAHHSTTLELPEKTAAAAEKLPVFSFSPLKDHIRTLPATAPEIHPEEVPDEQIIHIYDDVDPSPLQILKRQVDHLLMPPPSQNNRYGPEGS